MTHTRKTRDKKNTDSGNPVEVLSKSPDVYYAVPTGNFIGSSTEQMAYNTENTGQENTGHHGGCGGHLVEPRCLTNDISV